MAGRSVFLNALKLPLPQLRKKSGSYGLAQSLHNLRPAAQKQPPSYMFDESSLGMSLFFRKECTSGYDVQHGHARIACAINKPSQNDVW